MYLLTVLLIFSQSIIANSFTFRGRYHNSFSYNVHKSNQLTKSFHKCNSFGRDNTKHFGASEIPVESPSVKEETSKNNAISAFLPIWQFTRPHTIIGSLISIISLFAFATPFKLWKTKKFTTSLLASLLPSLLMNVYITGLNQVTDVEIDKINKPYLPIASGALSLKNGTIIVVLSLLLSLFIGIKSALPLQLTLLGSALLGTFYSLPPFRLKRFPLLAAFCILVVRGSIINLGFFFQSKVAVLDTPLTSLTQALQSYPESLLVTLFFAIFGLVIAIMKDVPDVKGDLKFNIRSFSVRVGAEKMFACAWRLLYTLLGMTSLGILATAVIPVLPVQAVSLSPFAHWKGTGGVALSCTALFVRVVASVVLGGFAQDVLFRARKVDSSQPDQVFHYYMYIWNIFYSCYLLLPLAAIA